MLRCPPPARRPEIFIILLLFPSGPRYLQIRCACLGATEQNWPDTHPRRTQMPLQAPDPFTSVHDWADEATSRGPGRDIGPDE